jgi:hypothetical protein
VVIDVTNEAQGNVIVLGVDPSGTEEAAPLQREGQAHLWGDLDSGKEPGQSTLPLPP